MDDLPPPPPAGGPEPITNPVHGRPQLFRTSYPGASEVHGHAKSFMDRLNDDKYAPYRIHNPYYPFANQEEWELGSFLLQSGMSMQKIDEYLRLTLVISS